MGKYFGTDGVRAVAGQFPLVDEFIEKLGYAALCRLQEHCQNESLKPQVIVAQDSRASGPSILAALQKGIRASGVNVISVGIAPTPCVAYLVKQTGSLCGVVISASHNPAEFNGIKFFTNQGTKLPEDLENAIEQEIDILSAIPAPRGTFTQEENLVKQYEQFLMSTVDASILKGTKVVLDCANGASYKIAANVFAGLGMNVTVTAAKPDGTNINKNVGALHTQFMQDLTVKENAFMGFSFDGDADRVIASDEKGRQLDGDNIIASSALCMKEQGLLNSNKAVLTIMANLGCINYLKENGVEVALTTVGDKYVSEALEKENLSIGGETSGHIIFRQFSNTGDGLLSALQFLQFVKKSGHPASFFTDQWKRYPSKLRAVHVTQKPPLETLNGFLPAVREIEKSMNGKGRVVVRYSGTEPKLRILVEGEQESMVDRVMQQVEDLYKEKTEVLK
ncbi:phosphoglucosamine mutase [Candidatus Avelusimicrobium caledoniensis]|uniref:phosphoglucosamine mutase n=1 Tax=Candidatus Avelusimicrobium caledoniensis TaxID=3416220 RepID=UPI003D146C97